MTAKKRSSKKRAAKASGSKRTKPKLLSGGNPQIPKGDGDAPVRSYIEAMPEWKRDIGRALDELIASSVPKVRRAVRWNSPFYGVEGNGWFLSFHCFTRYVKVTFLNGGDLDPSPPETSKYDHVRYLHLHENDDLDREQLRKWFQQASELPGDSLF